ncbi:hypothetical protein Poli38472_002854 [Pythium oligandrum]|uniref:Uncharacterized protein n=1 Tax=Pythium oligandrum TaxID=41045 RepID=A0A8K1C5P4_PYTOL|nr:hypothetical protein Poli38472_002854 [Pythium oligandrum]|eukprot:TMW56929.1 hypothetical protein Poli38472_002854 [Pythium oligandrum]
MARRMYHMRGVSSSSSDFSSCSSSSSSSSESSSDSQVEDFGVAGHSTTQLKRLRRIFLNQTRRQEHSDGSASGRSTKKTAAKKKKVPVRSKQALSHSEESSDTDDETMVNNQKQAQVSAENRLLPIDGQIQRLQEQMQLSGAQHDSKKEHTAHVLQQAIEELVFLQQQEQRRLERHLQLVDESYSRQLAQFEQQYRAAVSDLQAARARAIQQQREDSSLALVAAAKRLEEQTQRAVLRNHNETPNLEVSRKPRLYEAQMRTLSLETTTRRPSVVSVGRTESPLTKQKAKLQALEAKLAAFSRQTVDRVIHDLHRRERPRPLPSAIETEEPISSSQSKLRPTPLSPLRQRASYWRNGISWESPDNNQSQAKSIDIEPRTRQQSLSRRFLRPEEERELRALRNSIGLAKDWMEKHQVSSPRKPTSTNDNTASKYI